MTATRQYPKRYISTKAAVEYTTICRTSLLAKVKSGELSVIKVSRRKCLWDTAVLDKYMEDHTVGQAVA